MPGMDGRQLFDKLRGPEKLATFLFLFMAAAPISKERLRPWSTALKNLSSSHFWSKIFVRITKKVVDRLHLEKMQKHAARPGIIQGFASKK